MKAYIQTGINAHRVAGIGLGSNLNQGYAIVNDELTTYVTGLTTPLSDAQLLRLDTFISALKTGLSISALSDAFDVLRIYAGETSESSVKNLVKDAHHATPTNSPTWTQYEGYQGNGTSAYIEENWNGRTSGHAVAYTLNKASFGIYYRTNLYTNSSEVVNGVYSTTDDGGIYNRIFISRPSYNIEPVGQPGRFYVAVVNSDLQTGGDMILPSKTSISGMYIASRTASNSYKLYQNKTAIINSTKSVTKIPNQSLVTLARRTADTSVGLYDTNQISVVFLGKDFSQTDVNTITDAIEAYMDANGKGVIA